MLEIRNVTKVYRSKTGEEVRALDNVSINFPEAGMVFILGKSGSGKSTLLNVMGGLDSYDSGEFIIKGKSSNDFVGSDFDAYRNTFIGFIFQEYNVLDDFTVGANIGLALELQGKKATEEKINEILSSVDLLNYAHRKPNELSGGQKQRVAIARALVKEPQIIMADEPTGALDSNTGKQIFDALKELSKTKLVLIVSHDRDFAERYADRIIEMADGRIIEDVTKHEHQAEKISEGVHRINDNILRIESGYKLTAADLDMINAYLAKAGGDVLLSGDGRVNDELRSAAGISKDGATTVFEGTDPQKDIKTKKYEKDETKFIRSKLPMKNAVKMGASGLKHKKFRLVMTILLSFISFAMFGLSSSMAAYEKVNAATQSIIDTQIRSAAVTMGVRRTTTYDDGEMYSWHEEHAFTDEDLARLKAETGLDFYPVFTGSQYSHGENGFEMSHMFKQYESNTVFTGEIAGLVAMTREQLPADYTVIGNLPTAAGEIAITEFFYRQLQEYGYTYEGITIEGNALTMLDDGSANDIIGKTLVFNKIGWNQLSDSTAFKLTVVGVVNTNFNYDRYQNLLPKDNTQQQQGPEEEPSLMDIFLQKEVAYERDYGFHGLAFAHQDDINSMTAYVGGSFGGGSLGEYMNGENATMYMVAYQPADNDIDDDSRIDSSWYYAAESSKLSSITDVFWRNGAKTELGQNEVVISAVALQQYLRDQSYNMDMTALDTLFSGMSSKLDTDVYAEQKAYASSVMTAARNAAFAKYIKEQLAISEVSIALTEQANNAGYWDTDAAYKWWTEKWFNGDQGFVPEVAGYTFKSAAAIQSELYADTAVQNAVLAVYGIARPDNASAQGIVKLAQGLSEMYPGATTSLEDAYNKISRFYMTNFIVENGYHLADNYTASFVKNWLKDRDISNSDWLDRTDEQRFNELSESYYDLRWNTAKYGLDYVAYHQQAFNTYFAMSGTTLADLFTSLDGLYFQLEYRDYTSDADVVHKKLENLSVVGLFFKQGDGCDNMVIGSAVYDEYTAWKEARAEEFGSKFETDFEMNYTEDRVEHTPGMYAFAVAAIAADDEAAIQKLVELTYSDVHTTDFLFEMQNAVMYTLGSFNEIIEILAQVFVWVGLGLALFSALLLMNFISTSISYKKRDIGILRAVGARSSDVFKIFFSEAFIIALINFLLAVATSVAAVMVLNYYMRNSGINITLLSFGALQIIIMLGVSILVAALASFLPVRSIARKKPVDAIKDR